MMQRVHLETQPSHESTQYMCKDFLTEVQMHCTKVRVQKFGFLNIKSGEVETNALLGDLHHYRTRNLINLLRVTAEVEFDRN